MGTGGLSRARGFCDDFKAFISRGNVVDLAVGVIIGAAFGAIVTSLVNDIVSPVLGLISGQATLDELFVILKYANKTDEASKLQYPTMLVAKEKGAITLNYGRFLQTILYFLLIAFVLFLIIKLVYLVYHKETVKSTDWPCPKCKEKVKEGAVRCPHCAAEPIINPEAVKTQELTDQV